MSMASIEVIQKTEKKKIKIRKALEFDKESIEDQEVPIDKLDQIEMEKFDENR